MKLLKTILLGYVIIFLLGISYFVFAQTRPLEVVYPRFPGIQAPTGHPVMLPRYIRYLYYSSIFLGGLITLIALIAGGFRYLISAGNPGQMADAREQILMSVLGLLVILGSFVFLNELNPETVTLQPPSINPLSERAIIIYTDTACGNGSNGTPGLFFDLPPGISYIKIKDTQPIDSFDVQSFWASHASPILTEVAFFQNPDCAGDPVATFVPQTANSCNQTGLLSGIRCVRLRWHIPGVWLFSYANGNPEQPDPHHPYGVFQSDQANLPRGLRRNVRSLALVPDEKGVRYGVILHRGYGARTEKKGWAHLYLPPGSDIFRTNTENADVSSITVFQIDPAAPDMTIRICENVDCECQPDGQGNCQDASLRYRWGQMSPIPGLPPDIARAIVLRDGVDRWWQPDGETIAICEEAVFYNWIGHLAHLIGQCRRGVTAIKFESGAQYIAILYNYDGGNLNLDGIRNAPALVIDGTVRNLHEYRFDELTGVIFVIKVRR